MQMNRRGFLRGSALAAVALAGSHAFPASAAGQDAGQDAAKKEEPRQDEPQANADGGGDGKKEGEASPEQDPFKVTKKDEQGRDYRTCPQCGFNMYKQDRTWTCENCGYSYVE